MKLSPFPILIAFQAGNLVNDLHWSIILLSLLLAFFLQRQDIIRATEKASK